MKRWLDCTSWAEVAVVVGVWAVVLAAALVAVACVDLAVSR